MFRLVHVVFLLCSLSVGCSFVVEKCITSDGKDYKGRQQNSFTGKICRNWNEINLKFTDLDTGVGDHNFCRNPDGSEKPWCYVSDTNGGAKKEACDIRICQEQNLPEALGTENCILPTLPSTRTVETFEPETSFPSQVENAVVQPVKGVHQQVRTGPKKKKDLGTLEQNLPEALGTENSILPTIPSARTVETFEPETSFPSQVENAVVQPVKGVHQQVRTGPKKKKDLGTLGYVLAVLMMAIIILLGAGITVGYFYKRGRDLKKQHDQRVYEREMHRITLPLSAFTNPTCELVDENTIVIRADSNNQTPNQEGAEGGDPLMGPAPATPGA
ncbi:phosphoinositide-3-kinase-interacting protein 1 isoform X2 [Misgurnus anguillicaudatus]|uniref:phosphoinositide-3-kinase-interacting protein 1 isoform X2 n=1 Tax=Misgurnus anguillicaudatus TaxID=75329 RepID=UPI003CCFDD99